jgi:hypothetical protein
MIQIEVDNLRDICLKYTVQMHQALDDKCNNVGVLKSILTTSPLISIWDNNILHFKTAISIINLSSGAIDQKSNGNEILSHLNTNLATLITDLDDIETELINIIQKIRNEKLIESECNKLLSLNKKIKNNKFKIKLINFLFNYNNYRNILDNYIAKPLDLAVCPYCNRNFISYIPHGGDETTEKKRIGPTYDHFFHKSEYKFLSLSFYNLVPSCNVCNSNLKLSIDFHHKKHINPYDEGFGNDAIFDFDLATDTNTKELNFVPYLKPKESILNERKIKIFGDGLNNHSGNIRVFKLQEIYAFHHDTVEDIYMNFDKNNRFYSLTLKKELENLGTNEAEFYRFHFKNYFNEKDFSKRPLAKLTKDIYLKMKAVNDLT